MNKRLRKKNEKRVRKEIHKVLDLVLDINGVHRRKTELTGDLPTAFFEFNGHTASVGFSIYKDGWDFCKNSDTSHTCYMDHRFDRISDLICDLESAKEELCIKA